MKKLLKLVPATLVLVALASCSNDDLSGFGGLTASKHTLTLEMEDMGSELETRIAYTAKNKQIWQETDKFTVYDSELHKYDYYVYNAKSNTFERDGQQDLTEPQFVAFPSEMVYTTQWIKETRSTSIDMEIPHEWNFAEIAEEDGTAAYLSQLPMWGTAEADGDGIKAKVHFLTSYIKVTVDNALNNVKKVRVCAYHDIAGNEPAPIAGVAHAKLSENEVPLEETALTAPEEGYNTITVNLEDKGEKFVKTGTSCIFIPIIAGTYGQVKVQYLPATIENETENDWENIKVWYEKEFERGGLPYGASMTDLKASAKTVAQLNEAIAANVTKKGDVTLTVETGEKTAVSSTDKAVGNVVVLPDMACDKITLNVNSFNGTDSEELEITGSIKKPVVLNVKDVSVLNSLKVNLPDADVTLAGMYKTSSKSIEVNLYNAKSITIGDGNVDTYVMIRQHRAEIGNVTIEKKGSVNQINLSANHKAAKVTVKGDVNYSVVVPASELVKSTEVVVEATGTVAVKGTTANASNGIDMKNGGSVNVEGKVQAITVTGSAEVTLSGVAGSVTAGTGKVTINGAPTYDAKDDKITDAVDYAKVGTVVTKGDVEIALTGEGVAVGTSVTLEKGKTITLKQGYVKSIIGSGTTNTNKVNVVLGTEPAYQNVLLGTGQFNVTGTTKWNGKTIGEGIPAANTNKNTIKSSFETYKDVVGDVYTATGLVSNAGSFTLKNNIDLNNAEWAPATQTGVVDGGGKTISNLKVKAPKDGDAACTGLGLFSALSNNVSNLTLETVTVNAVPYKVGSATGKTTVNNIGALAGSVSSAVTISKVNVKNATLTSTGGAAAIGGIVGKVSEATTFSGVSVLTCSINGYKALGGLVGEAAANVTVDAAAGTPAVNSSVSGVSFTANHNSKPADAQVAVDNNYLMTGNIIGTLGSAVTAVTIDKATSAADTKTVDITIFTNDNGYTGEGDTNSFNIYPYVFGQSYIGFCGKTLSASVTMKDKADWTVSETKPEEGDKKNYLYYLNKEDK